MKAVQEADGHEELRISLGTESIVRANFAKGFFFHDDESVIKCVESLIPFNKEEEIKEILEKYKNLTVEIRSMNERMSLSNSAEIYMSIKEKIDHNLRIIGLKKESQRLRTILSTFIIITMEKKELLREEFTTMGLTKLPLILKGARSMSEAMEEGAEEDYEEY